MEQVNPAYLRSSNFKWHVLMWVLFLTYESVAAYLVNGSFSRPIDYVTFNFINICLFYLTADIIIKNSVNGKVRYPKIILFILIEIVVYTAIKYFITPLYTTLGFYKPNPKPPLFYVTISLNVFRGIYFVGFATAYALSQVALASRERAAELDKQRLEIKLEHEQTQKALLVSEYAFLKAQINPHFLFNMLSFLHSQVYKYSEDLGDQIIHLADLMRYAFTEPDEDGKVELAAEVAHIENYISLNTTRFNHKLYLNFTSAGDIDDIRIIPLILVTLIENVFKYGELSDPEHPAIVYLTVTGRELHLHIANRKVKRNYAFSSGIGMVNVQKRLDQVYPNNNKILIEQDGLSYQLDLIINVPQNEMLHNR